MWSAAEQARADGADIRAVTLWALFGTVDWRSLLTRREGIYDVGAFDTRSRQRRARRCSPRRRRSLAAARRSTIRCSTCPAGGGGRAGLTRARATTRCRAAARAARPILITGATGTLGQAFARICAHRGLAHVLTSRAELDITDEASIAAALERHKPWAVINTAGFVRVCGRRAAGATNASQTNATGPSCSASACRLHGIPLVTFSSDLVFDGKLGRPYVEPDAAAPACAYGRSKAEAERGCCGSTPTP